MKIISRLIKNFKQLFVAAVHWWGRKLWSTLDISKKGIKVQTQQKAIFNQILLFLFDIIKVLRITVLSLCMKVFFSTEHPSVATLTLTVFDYSAVKQKEVLSVDSKPCWQKYPVRPVLDYRMLSSIFSVQAAFAARHHRHTFHPAIQAVLGDDMTASACGQAGGTARGSCCQRAACYHRQPDVQTPSRAVSATSITISHPTVQPPDMCKALSPSSPSSLSCDGLKSVAGYASDQNGTQEVK